VNKINIYNGEPNKAVFHDSRGVIADVFYNAKIDHVAYITSLPGSIRGNHYHKHSIQHILITMGSLEYWYANKDNLNDSKYTVAVTGDLITSSASEVHALRILGEGCSFVAFSEGKRGGQDYESDTFRVDSIIKG
jgi:dTDP-4-dehydrorhamnose 3,5-epimerase-like enzyme